MRSLRERPLGRRIIPPRVEIEESGNVETRTSSARRTADGNVQYSYRLKTHNGGMPIRELRRNGVSLFTLEDGWTIVTRDGSPSAQFEHTLLVTNTGVEVLTAD